MTHQWGRDGGLRTHFSPVDLPFKINYRETATESESRILEQTLQQWCNLQDWDKRIFRMFRNTIKYGDQFFIRDPETKKYSSLDPVRSKEIMKNHFDIVRIRDLKNRIWTSSFRKYDPLRNEELWCNNINDI